jgi:hypothetical protein
MAPSEARRLPRENPRRSLQVAPGAALARTELKPQKDWRADTNFDLNRGAFDR